MTTILYTVECFFFFSPLPLSHGRKDRNLLQLLEAATTCHQGHSQGVITLDPGPKLQRLKSTPSSLSVSLASHEGD